MIRYLEHLPSEGRLRDLGFLSCILQRFNCFSDLLQSAGNNVIKLLLLMDNFVYSAPEPGKSALRYEEKQ